MTERNPKGAGRPCSVCSNSERDGIDREIVAGTAVTEISRKFGISLNAVSRHRLNHMPRAALEAAAEAVADVEAGRGGGLLGAASELREKAMSLLRKAEDEGDVRTALMGVREAIRCVELMARLAGEIDQSSTVNITFAPQFLYLQKTVIQALSHHPEALRAVQGAFIQLEGIAEQ